MEEIYLYDRKNIIKNGKINVWTAFAGCEAFALSSLGYLWIYKIFDEMSDVNVERICSDTKSTKIPIECVNLIAYSFSFDFDFLTFFQMFDKFKIPYKTKDRGENFPLICAGGPVVTSNPEPYKDIFDFFIIGDGEDITVEMTEILRDSSNCKKCEILHKLSKIEGVYVPYLSKTVTKRTKELKECVYTPILSEKAFFKNTFIVEVERGCANCCGFCLASYLNLPVRCTDCDDLFNIIKTGLNKTNKIALLGAQISAHPNFSEICDYIKLRIDEGEEIEMNLSSIRIDAVKPNIIKALVAAGQKTTTMAIEAGSESLRKTINKHVDESQILNAVKIAAQNGLKGIKIYGMIGLPTETDSDIKALIELAKKIKNENKGFNISFGFSTFVPKPHTPFQWFGRDSVKSLTQKIEYLKKEFSKLGIKTSFASPKWDYWQAVMSRGDSSLGDFIIDVYKSGGKLGAFNKIAKKYSIDTEKLAQNCYDFSENFPWDFIEIKPGKEALIRENNRLMNLN